MPLSDMGQAPGPPPPSQPCAWFGLTAILLTGAPAALPLPAGREPAPEPPAPLVHAPTLALAFRSRGPPQQV